MSSNTLQNYYQTIFSLVTHYHYSIEEIEDIYPFERDIYVQMLNNYIAEKKQAQGKSGGDGAYESYIREFIEAEAKTKKQLRPTQTQ